MSLSSTIFNNFLSYLSSITSRSALTVSNEVNVSTLDSTAALLILKPSVKELLALVGVFITILIFPVLITSIIFGLSSLIFLTILQLILLSFKNFFVPFVAQIL